MTMTRRGLGLGALALGAASAVPFAAQAETFNIRMVNQNRGGLRGAAFAIPAYHVNFVTSQQATSVASITARTRLALVMEGPDQALMRRLTNEAHADLRTQMEAAGLPLVSIADTRAMVQASGMELQPDNVEIAGIGPSITIGASLKRGWASFGADDAPMLTALKNMRGGNLAQIGAIHALSPLNRQPQLAGNVAIAPSLVLDFARMDARRPGLFGNTASVDGNVAFGVLMDSRVATQKPANMGVGTPGGFNVRESVWSPTPFATVVQGGAAVRAGPSFSDHIDDSYRAIQRARGDAVMINVPVWEGLVRDAFRSYNAAIVQTVRSAQG